MCLLRDPVHPYIPHAGLLREGISNMSKTPRPSAAIRRGLVAALGSLALGASFLLAAPAGAASTFQVGDVFVGVGNSHVQWYDKNGTLKETLDTGKGGGVFTTGMAFDASGHLYVTNFNGTDKGAANAGTPNNPKATDSGSVSEFNTSGQLLGDFGAGAGYNTPESILFDRSGDAYVGNVGGNPGILKLDGSGNLIKSSNAGVRTDWIDLAADQC